MKNKILVNIYIPQLDEEYDLYIPLNKNIANIILLVEKTIKEQTGITEINLTNLLLYNTNNGMSYDPGSIIRETNIKNSDKLILM